MIFVGTRIFLLPSLFLSRDLKVINMCLLGYLGLRRTCNFFFGQCFQFQFRIYGSTHVSTPARDYHRASRITTDWSIHLAGDTNEAHRNVDRERIEKRNATSTSLRLAILLSAYKELPIL